MAFSTATQIAFVVVIAALILVFTLFFLQLIVRLVRRIGRMR